MKKVLIFSSVCLSVCFYSDSCGMSDRVKKLMAKQEQGADSVQNKILTNALQTAQQNLSAPAIHQNPGVQQEVVGILSAARNTVFPIPQTIATPQNGQDSFRNSLEVRNLVVEREHRLLGIAVKDNVAQIPDVLDASLTDGTAAAQVVVAIARKIGGAAREELLGLANILEVKEKSLALMSEDNAGCTELGTAVGTVLSGAAGTRPENSLNGLVRVGTGAGDPAKAVRQNIWAHQGFLGMLSEGAREAVRADLPAFITGLIIDAAQAIGGASQQNVNVIFNALDVLAGGVNTAGLFAPMTLQALRNLAPLFRPAAPIYQNVGGGFADGPHGAELAHVVGNIIDMLNLAVRPPAANAGFVTHFLAPLFADAHSHPLVSEAAYAQGVLVDAFVAYTFNIARSSVPNGLPLQQAAILRLINPVIDLIGTDVALGHADLVVGGARSNVLALRNEIANIQLFAQGFMRGLGRLARLRNDAVTDDMLVHLANGMLIDPAPPAVADAQQRLGIMLGNTLAALAAPAGPGVPGVPGADIAQPVLERALGLANVAPGFHNILVKVDPRLIPLQSQLKFLPVHFENAAAHSLYAKAFTSEQIFLRYIVKSVGTLPQAQLTDYVNDIFAYLDNDHTFDVLDNAGAAVAAGSTPRVRTTLPLFAAVNQQLNAVAEIPAFAANLIYDTPVIPVTTITTNIPLGHLGTYPVTLAAKIVAAVPLLANLGAVRGRNMDANKDALLGCIVEEFRELVFGTGLENNVYTRTIGADAHVLLAKSRFLQSIAAVVAPAAVNPIDPTTVAELTVKGAAPALGVAGAHLNATLVLANLDAAIELRFLKCLDDVMNLEQGGNVTADFGVDPVVGVIANPGALRAKFPLLLAGNIGVGALAPETKKALQTLALIYDFYKSFQ